MALSCNKDDARSEVIRGYLSMVDQFAGDPSDQGQRQDAIRRYLNQNRCRMLTDPNRQYDINGFSKFADYSIFKPCEVSKEQLWKHKSSCLPQDFLMAHNYTAEPVQVKVETDDKYVSTPEGSSSLSLGEDTTGGDIALRHRSIRVIIDDIDLCKGERGHKHYKYRDLNTQLVTCETLARKYGLRVALGDKDDKELGKDVHEAVSRGMAKMAASLGYPLPSIWSEGSAAFDQVPRKARDSLFHELEKARQLVESREVAPPSYDPDGVKPCLRFLAPNHRPYFFAPLRIETALVNASDNPQDSDFSTEEASPAAKRSLLVRLKSAKRMGSEETWDGQAQPVSKRLRSGTDSGSAALCSPPTQLSRAISAAAVQGPELTSAAVREGIPDKDSTNLPEDGVAGELDPSGPTASVLPSNFEKACIVEQELEPVQPVQVWNQLRRGVQDLVHCILSGLGLQRLANRQTMPMLSARECGSMEELYIQCWGPNWAERQQFLKNLDELSIGDVLHTLIAAFLFKKILHPRPKFALDTEKSFFEGVQTALDSLESLVSTSGTIDEHGGSYDPTFRHAVLRSTQSSFQGMIRAAITTSLNREAFESRMVELAAQELEAAFHSTFQNTFERLRTLAILLDPETDQKLNPGDGGLTTSLLTQVLQNAIRFKLRAETLPYGHRAFWPSMGTQVSISCHKSRYQLDPKKLDHHVTYTLFPGLAIRDPDLGRQESFYDELKAAVLSTKAGSFDANNVPLG